MDSLRLAEEIQKEAEKKQVTVPILLQVNVAKEESKSGFYEEELMDAAERVAGRLIPPLQVWSI